MSSIVLVDTSVLLNILDVPGYNQDHQSIQDELLQLIDQGDTLLLPMATLLETGSHIADIPNGFHRREWGKAFVKRVRATYQGEAPWAPIAFPTLESIMPWLDDYPDYAMREVGFADVTIIKDWKKACSDNPMTRVWIWSIDTDLSGYDSGAIRKP